MEINWASASLCKCWTCGLVSELLATRNRQGSHTATHPGPVGSPASRRVQATAASAASSVKPTWINR